MRVNRKSLVGWLMVTLLSSAGLTAADLRLVEAVKNQRKELVRTLLKQKVDVNEPQPDGATALHWAAHWNDLEMVDLLIAAGARADVANDYGVTPISLAATNGNVAIIEKLLKAGASPSASLPTGKTVLMTAARTGNVDAVNALLTAGADPNAGEASQGQTALMWAASEGHLDVARTLIDHGATLSTPSKTGFTPLLFAAREGDLEIVRLLLANGANVNETAGDGTTPLLVATVRGHAALASFLLDEGADPNAAGAGFSPLHWAVGRWETNLTGEDLGIKAPPSSEWSRLDGLQGQAKLDLIKTLLAHGADPNARAVRNVPRFGGGGGPNLTGGTPFVIAAMSADVATMKLLLAAGADPKQTTTAGVTPLMAAAGLNRNFDSPVRSRGLEAVKFLVQELGANVNAANNAGDTILHAAAAQGADDIVQYLVEKEANLDTKNKLGWTPLTYAEGYYVNATWQVFAKTVELLRKLGASSYTLDCGEDGNKMAYFCSRDSTNLK